MEFRTWGEYSQWLKDTQLPVFTMALGLARETDAEAEQEKRQEKADTLNPDATLESCDDSLSRAEFEVAQLEELFSELLQMSAEFDQLTSQSRCRATLLQNNTVHAERLAVASEGKTLALQSVAIDFRLAALDARTLAAISLKEQLRCAVKIQRGLFEREETAHQARLAAARQNLAQAESRSHAYARALSGENSRLQAISRDEGRVMIEEEDAIQADARVRGLVAEYSRELEAMQDEKVAVESKVTESERRAGNSARLNLRLTLETSEKAETASKKKEDLQLLVGALALQETSVEEGPYRLHRLKSDFKKRLEEQARRLYAKSVTQRWKMNAADFREVRRYREARKDEEDKWLQQQKCLLEGRERPKKSKRTRKKEGSRHPAKKLVDTITSDDLMNSFNKMD